MKNEENFLIEIDGTQFSNGSEDSLRLSTLGSFGKKPNGDFQISYYETEATGFAGDLTTLTIDDAQKVTLSRSGATNTQLILEKNQRHLCHYDTPYGNLIVGINADTIVNELADNGGFLRFRYSLDVNANELSVNELKIKVTENKKYV